MPNNTLTNKIYYTLEYSKFLELYPVYKILNESRNAKEYRAFYAGIRDKIKPLAHAVDGKYTLVVLEKNALAKDYTDEYQIKQLHFAELKKEKKYILLRLINSLLAKESGYFEVEDDPYGLYYLVDCKPSKLQAIKIDINRDMFLSLSVKTFIKTKSVKDGYIINNSKLVKATQKNDGLQLYKAGNYANKKSTYRFLGLMQNSKKSLISESKIYILMQYIKEVKRTFENIVELGFHKMEIELYDDGRDSINRKAMMEAHVRKTIGELLSIHIANYSGIDIAEEIEKLKQEIIGYLKVPITISDSKSIQSNRYNFTITLSEDYYKTSEEQDPYRSIHQDPTVIVQNLTVDTLRKIFKDKKLLYVLLKELVIKQEIQDLKITLPYNKSIINTSVIYPHKEKTKEYIFYKIIICGTQIKFDKLTRKEKHICAEIAFGIKDTSILEAVIFRENNIGYITRSKEFPLPKIDKITKLLQEHREPKYLHSLEILKIWDDVYDNEKKVLRENLTKEIEKYKDIFSGNVLLEHITLGKNNNRFKVALEKSINKSLVLSLKGKKEHRYCINSLIGIQYSKTERKYYIGVNNNLPQSINNASRIREVCTYGGDNLIELVLEMLSEYFIKNGNFTVLPYPLKYCREYYKLNSQK